MSKWLLNVFCAMFLTACQTLSLEQLPSSSQESRLFKVKNETTQTETLLSIQFQPQLWRWVQTDPLGMPKARFLLSAQGWQNEGFIMPNPQAKQLFSALSNALFPQTPLFKNESWRLNSQPPIYRIRLADQSQWLIEELPQ